MGNTSGRARARLRSARQPVTTTGVTLAVLLPLLTAAPAQAGLVDLVDLTAPTPVIDQGEAGHVEALGTVVCESDGSVRKVCDPVSLAGLDVTAVASLLLTAVPADPADTVAWTDCPAPLGAVCSIPLTDLAGTTPLAPVVEFLPGLGGGDAAAPDTKITSAGPGRQRTTHTFTFEALAADGAPSDTATFECKLDVTPKGTPPATEQSHDWRACGADPVGTQSYRDLADGDYVFGVRAVEPPATEGGEPATDATPATQAWTVALPPEVPETSVVSGPRSGAWVLGNKVAYAFRSTVEGSRFDCTYDGQPQGTACDDGAWSMRGLTRGTHVFTVAAAANNTRDFSAARRTFQVPLDDRAMAGAGWTRSTLTKHFKNTVSTTARKGATLTTRQTLRFRRVVLVADKGRGFGTVKVYWGSKLLKEVSLHARRLRQRQVIPVKTFDGGKLRSGRLRVVVVTSGRTVRVDGIGVARR